MRDRLDGLLARAEAADGGAADRPRILLALVFEAAGLLAAFGLGTTFWLVGSSQVAVVYWGFGGLLILNVAIGLRWGRIAIARFVALTLVLVVPFVLMFLLGGFTGLGVSAATLSLLSPMGAMMLVKRERAIPLVAASIVLLLLMLPLQTHAPQLDPQISTDTASLLAMAHLVLFFLTVSTLTYISNRRLEAANRRIDTLLLNVLPEPIAERLKAGSEQIADRHENVTVLFADIVEFTPLSADMKAEEVVGLLNQIFSAFDSIAAEMGLEKIKTVGDEYMVAAGLPVHRPDHATAIADFALAARDHLATTDYEGHRIRMRIGINSGPVVAGIIGTQKFAYDLWGDTVNTASRMESDGIENGIQITDQTYQRIRNDFTCQPRGNITIKGKGELPTYLLISRKPETPAH